MEDKSVVQDDNMAPPEGKVGAALPQSSGFSLTYMLGPQSLGNCSHGV
jgi:hypothetical protein